MFTPLVMSWPSSLMPNVLVGAPLTRMEVLGTQNTPAVSTDEARGLRTPCVLAVAGPTPRIGSEFMRSVVTLEFTAALSVLNIEAAAETVTDSVDVPTSRTTSTRMVWAAWTPRF